MKRKRKLTSTEEPPATSAKRQKTIEEGCAEGENAPAQGDEKDNMDLELTCKWGKEKITLRASSDWTVKQLRDLLREKTNVLHKRQKIIGIKPKKGKLADCVRLGDCRIKFNKFMMIGNPEKEQYVKPDTSDIPQVLDDLDWDYAPDVNRPEACHQVARADLDRVVKEAQVNIINAPRKGKKLLVLDIDYTIYDMKQKLPEHQFMWSRRPGTEDMLRKCWPHYDIVFWSQTKWIWIEAKLTELGLFHSPHYNVNFILDKSMMIYTESFIRGKTKRHQVKALELIWRKFPETYNAHNTIHIDDLGRNFALNPQQGLKISPYKDCRVARHIDQELPLLTEYLLKIARLDSFESLDHSKWKSYEPPEEK